MPITQAVNSKANIKKATNNDLPFASQQPVINSFYATSTTAQTAISNLGFSVNTTLTGYTDNFFLFVNGQKLTLGTDYSFSAIAADGTSSSILFIQPLAAGQPIQAYKLGLKPEVEFQTDTRFTTAYDWADKSFQGWVNQSTLITATATAGSPAAGTFYSSIVGRAPLPDLTQDLGVRLGSERIMNQNYFPIQTEVGPNNELVYGVQNDTLGRLRYVGIGWTYNNDVSGTYLSTSGANNFVEVTFYGTGLTGLIMTHVTGDLRVSVDGGAEGSNILPTVANSLINGRNYAQNQPLTLASNLSLGVHTVKVRVNSGGMIIHGVEILNESISLKVNAGIGYIKGQKATLAAQFVSAFNSVFDAGSITTRGGHVVVYQKSDGTIGKAVTAPGSQLNLTAADHSNEEVARQFNVREFGAQRTDDFSTITGSASSRAFTLDDGVTTMTAVSMALDSSAAFKEGLVPAQTSGSVIYLTFVGTGIDVFNASSGSNSSTWTILVDNVAIATNAASSTFSPTQWNKMVSGLAYGCHTLQIHVGSTVGSAPRLSDFRVWQPKKPAIPAGAIELADYCIMGTYTQPASASSSAGATVGAISQGVMRKMSIREAVFFGTWSAISLDSSNFDCGQNINTSTAASFVQYTFVGTGFEFGSLINTNSLAVNITISVDGVTNLTGAGYTTSIIQGSTGLSFNGATGVVSGTSVAAGVRVRYCVNGLSYGLHTVKITFNSGAVLFVDGFDIVVPIYAAKSNSPGDLNNTLMVGSTSISDNRKYTPVKDSVVYTKAWSVATDLATNPTITAATLVPMPDMTAPIFLKQAGVIHIQGVVTVTNSASNGTTLQIYVDGVAVGRPSFTYAATGMVSAEQSLNVAYSLPVSAGHHLVQLYWASSSGGTSQVERRTLAVREN